MSGSALADMTPRVETDVIDDWSVLGITVDARPIVEGSPFVYTHDLTDQVKYGIGEYVTDATLTLDFTDMGADGVSVPTEWTWSWDVWAFVPTEWEWLPDEEFGFGEYVTVALLGNGTVVDLGEIDDDTDVQSIVDLNVALINDDGKLDVAVSVSNRNLGWGTIALDCSTLTASVVPVPGAVLLGMLGLSAAGLRLRKRA
jgi:hypothetical protein